MAVIRHSSTIANGDTLTMPSHQEHDLLIAIIYRHDSTTAPTDASGWKLLTSSSSNSNHIRVLCKVAANGSETFGTWTNATQVACVVYRSDASLLLWTASTNSGGGTTTSVTYNTVTAREIHNSSAFFVGAVGLRLNDSDGDTAPSGMTNIVNIAGVSDGELAVHDTNAEVSNWSATTFTASGSVVHRTAVVSVLETMHPVPTGGGGEYFYGSF
jgi:hypothetical protein